VASLSVDTLSEWLLQDLGFHRLELGHSVLNTASCHVEINARVIPEGTLRSALSDSNGWHDVHWHARLRLDSPHAPELQY
jgi:RimJ/RimL family protein N-acetyltransferase